MRWVILPGKAIGDADFVASATDLQTDAVIDGYGYRGGPFVIDSADAAAALPIITAWQAGNVTTVHVATAAFDGTVSKLMVAAPLISVFADGNEGIAYGYLNAAGIPDSDGAAWANGSPSDSDSDTDTDTDADADADAADADSDGDVDLGDRGSTGGCSCVTTPSDPRRAPALLAGALLLLSSFVGAGADAAPTHSCGRGL